MVMVIDGKSPEDIASEELDRKLKKELRFRREMRKQLNDIADDFRLFYSRIGNIPSVRPYVSDIRKVLRDNYRSISKEFSKSIRRQLGIKQNIDTEIDAEMQKYIENHSTEQADIIANTTQQNARRFYESAAVLLASQGIDDKEQVAKEATNKFRDNNKERSETIAQTETQNVAETAKQQEATVLADALVVSGTAKVLRKRWNAILDNKTRTDHAFADGQKVNIGENFSVGGERLKYPGDTSLGASPKNVINCRCTVNYVIDG